MIRTILSATLAAILALGPANNQRAWSRECAAEAAPRKPNQNKPKAPGKGGKNNNGGFGAIAYNPKTDKCGWVMGQATLDAAYAASASQRWVSLPETPRDASR